MTEIKCNKRKKLAAVLCLFLASFLFLSACADPAPAETAVGQSPVTEEEKLPLSTTETVEDAETQTQAPSKEDLPREPLFHGIDVSKWQGRIDWAKVKESGVEFAMIRLGYGDADGCGEDSTCYYNLTEAEKNGILIGVYFYSEAQTPAEAREEAEWVLSRIKGYAISFPVVMDWESAGKDLSISAAVRTDTALSFLRAVSAEGYEAMLYAPITELEDETMWETHRITKEFYLWGAAYTQPAYPEVSYPETELPLALWQYSDKGRVSGISGNVDRNVCYVPFVKKEAVDATDRPDTVTTPDGFKQTFSKVEKSVTAKIEVNLRSAPSMDSSVVATLLRGRFLPCTGESDMGWSRLTYEGKTVYAVTSYLSETVTEEQSDPAAGHSFRRVSERVTAKEEVNMRSTPSTDSAVVAVLKNGEYVERIGLGDRGWDKLLYEGKEVFAVSSYLEVQE